MRAVTRIAGSVSSRCLKSSRFEHINYNTTGFANPGAGMMESPEKVLSSPTTTLAKLLSHQITASNPPSSSLPYPVNLFATAFEEDRKLDKLCKTFVLRERQGNVARAWEPTEKEMWLERFGGPGKRLEKVVGHGTVVLRDAGPDGKGYLRVLI